MRWFVALLLFSTSLALATDFDGDGLDDQVEVHLGTSPVMVNSDGDGITNDDEGFLGSDTDDSDTDDDGVNDGDEVDHSARAPAATDTVPDGGQESEEFTCSNPGLECDPTEVSDDHQGDPKIQVGCSTAPAWGMWWWLVLPFVGRRC
jgi:hypothetical protein